MPRSFLYGAGKFGSFLAFLGFGCPTSSLDVLQSGADEEDRKISKKMLQQPFAGASSYYVMPRSARLLAA